MTFAIDEQAERRVRELREAYDRVVIQRMAASGSNRSRLAFAEERALTAWCAAAGAILQSPAGVVRRIPRRDIEQAGNDGYRRPVLDAELAYLDAVDAALGAVAA